MSIGTLTALERKELERRARSRSPVLEPFRRRAKVILMLSAGASYSEISKRLGCTVHYISYWQGRFKQERLIGLNYGCPAAERRPDSSEIGARILAKLIRYIRQYNRNAIPIRWIYQCT